jgi:gamma-polyglutamate biosynthesis protein CapA
MSLSIFAVGDIMMGEQPLCHGFGVKSKISQKGTKFLFKDINSILRCGDIVLGNLEAPASDITNKKGIYADYFRAGPESIRSLKDAGFNFLGVANNHIMEHGSRTFESTIDLLRENGIAPVGIRDKVQTFKKGDLIIGLFSYSLIEDFAKDHPYNKFSSSEEVLDDLSITSEKFDLAIVSIHWGCEYVPYPSLEQVELGRRLVDSGADIVLGSHPHVLQGYEIYKKKPIFYSLGNFIFDHTYIKTTRKTIIAKIEVSGNNKEIKIDVIPLVCSSADYSPLLANHRQKDEILSFLSSSLNMLEGKSVKEYADFLGDYNELSDKYRKIAKREMRLFFAKNFFLYPLELKMDILKKQFCQFLGSRA